MQRTRLKQIEPVRKAGTISVPGAHIGLLDKIPFGAAMNTGPNTDAQL